MLVPGFQWHIIWRNDFKGHGISNAKRGVTKTLDQGFPVALHPVAQNTLCSLPSIMPTVLLHRGCYQSFAALMGRGFLLIYRLCSGILFPGGESID